jgi:hypothetical protein
VDEYEEVVGECRGGHCNCSFWKFSKISPSNNQHGASLKKVVVQPTARRLAPTELLQGSRALGIIFEFWENLALRFLKDPNFHDEEIWDAITEGPGGLDFVDFTEKENF